MTTHGDGIYQYGGVPVPFPAGFMTPPDYGKYYGRVFWVDDNGGSDNNTGLKPNRAKKTIAAAITLMNTGINWSRQPWAKNDTVFIFPGRYTENLTAMPYGGNVVGLGDAFDFNGERGVTILPASGSPLDATSVINARIHNIDFESPDTSPAFDVENCNRNIFSHCVFRGCLANNTSHAFRVKDETNADGNGDCTGTKWTDCLFHRAVIGLEIETDNGSSKQASGCIIERSYFTGISSKGIYFHADCVPSFTVINHCVVGDGSTTLTLGLDDDTDLVGCNNTMFTATGNDPDGTSTGDGYNNCYLNGGLLDNA